MTGSSNQYDQTFKYPPATTIKAVEESEGEIRIFHSVKLEICCSFENLAVNYTFSFHSADKFANEQQMFGLNYGLSV